MKTVKTNDSINLTEIIDNRGWQPLLIPIYLGVNTVYRKSIVIKVENKLTKMGIEWRVKK